MKPVIALAFLVKASLCLVPTAKQARDAEPAPAPTAAAYPIDFDAGDLILDEEFVDRRDPQLLPSVSLPLHGTNLPVFGTTLKLPGLPLASQLSIAPRGVLPIMRAPEFVGDLDDLLTDAVGGNGKRGAGPTPI